MSFYFLLSASGSYRFHWSWAVLVTNCGNTKAFLGYFLPTLDCMCPEVQGQRTEQLWGGPPKHVSQNQDQNIGWHQVRVNSGLTFAQRWNSAVWLHLQPKIDWVQKTDLDYSKPIYASKNRHGVRSQGSSLSWAARNRSGILVPT